MDFFYAIYNLLLSHVIQVFNLYGLDVIHAYSFDVYLIYCAIFGCPILYYMYFLLPLAAFMMKHLLSVLSY